MHKTIILLIVVGLTLSGCYMQPLEGISTPTAWDLPRGVFQLDPDPGPNLLEVVWSPDGSRIATSLVSIAGNYCTKGKIFIFNVASRQMETLVEEKDRPCSMFTVYSWSPDGEKLAFGGEGSWVVSTDGSSEFHPVDLGSSIVWSPEGTRMAALREDLYEEGGLWVRDVTIWVLDLKTGEKRSALRHRGAKVDMDDLSWSPDGSRLAFNLEDADSTMVGVLNLNTGEEVFPFRYEDTGAWLHDLSWSPNGTHLAFVLSHRSEEQKLVADILVLDILTGQIHRLASGDFFTGNPTWSPDGKMIAYVKEDSSVERLVISPLDGGCSVEVIKGIPFSDVKWSPNGKWIAFTSRGNIYIVDIATVLGENFLITGPVCP